MAPSDFRTSEPQEARSRTDTRMTREQLVDRIISMNPTATTEFLDSFDDYDLNAYLDRLSTAREPRGSHARRIRPGDSAAISERRRTA